MGKQMKQLFKQLQIWTSAHTNRRAEVHFTFDHLAVKLEIVSVGPEDRVLFINYEQISWVQINTARGDEVKWIVDKMIFDINKKMEAK